MRGFAGGLDDETPEEVEVVLLAIAWNELEGVLEFMAELLLTGNLKLRQY